MTWAAILGLTIVVFIIWIVDRKRVKTSTGRTKITFWFLTVVGWVIGALLFLFPDMPGPSQLWLLIFKPLSNMVGIH
ncbi:hypothetical protein J31TS6_48390 [Brevibacillus reuszeri]|nr:hypothetical protein J31TS6_48390 [Brevibacillus reuszeri]